MNDINNGNDVVFQDLNDGQVRATPTGDGNYMYKGRKISKDELGSTMGLPGYNYSGGVAGSSGPEDGHISAEMVLGEEKEIVERFNDNEYLKNKGFSVDREWETGGKYMNIYHKDGGQVMINLDDKGVVKKINTFINNQLGKTSVTQPDKISETDPLG